MSSSYDKTVLLFFSFFFFTPFSLIKLVRIDRMSDKKLQMALEKRRSHYLTLLLSKELRTLHISSAPIGSHII